MIIGQGSRSSVALITWWGDFQEDPWIVVCTDSSLDQLPMATWKMGNQIHDDADSMELSASSIGWGLADRKKRWKQKEIKGFSYPKKIQ